MGNLPTSLKKNKITRDTSRNEPATKACWYLIPVNVGNKGPINMKFSSKDIHEVKHAFELYDKLQDGTIPTKHFISVMRALGLNLTEEQTLDMICEVDYDRTGVIHFMEFAELWAKYSVEFDDIIIREAFHMFDKDGSGSISIEEFREMVETEGAELTDEEIEDILKEADTDGDGQIDIDEFVALLINSGAEF